MVRMRVEEAARDFEALVQRVAAGEDVVLMQEGVPVARLSPYVPPLRQLEVADWLRPKAPQAPKPVEPD